MTNPQDALLAKLNTLSPAQRDALLAKLKQQEKPPVNNSIHTLDRQQESFTLSYAQTRLWFLQTLYPESAAYNIAGAIELNGVINASLLEQSFQHLIARHESLRTAFIENEHGAQQIILPQPTWQMTQSEIGKESLENQLEKDAQYIFDLRQAPLFRAHLYTLSESQSVLSIVLHHIISDAWSTQILLNEMSQIYRALQQKQTPQLAELDVQYVDYAAWQKNTPVAEAQIHYWQDTLKNCENLQLAGDLPRPNNLSQNGATHSITLAPALSHALQSLAQQHNSTLYIVFLTLFEILLYRYSQQTHFAIGTPVAGRNHRQTQALIGFFVNTLALPCDISVADTFTSLLAKVRQRSMAAQDKQDISFEQLIDCLNLPRDSRHSPLFQAFFTYQADDAAQFIQLPNISARFIDINNHTAKFDLSLIVRETADGTQCLFEYNRDIYLASEVAQWAQDFQTLCQIIPTHTEQALETLHFFPLPEEQGKNAALPINNIKTLFEQQAAKTPQAIAVKQADKTLTFATLDKKANQLAHYLLQQGISEGQCVALYFAPCLELAIALLAVIKTGAAYLPLDPSYPKPRLNYMLDNSRTHTVLSSQRFDTTDLQANIICIDNLNLATYSDSAPLISIAAQQLLYVIYTSGSTGQPKGAMVSHANAANLLTWYSQTYQLNAEDKFLVFSAIGFDLTQKNLLAPLCFGGQLHFAAEEYYDPQALLHTIASEKITWLNCAPSAFYPLVQKQNLPALASLRKLFFGGENIILSHLHPWLNSSYFHAKITNMYGPTECTDIACAHTLADPRTTQHSIAIGRAIDNVHLYVLDKNQQILPKGAIGELYIGGASVGLGYLHDTQKTAESFINNPFGAGKLYKTGDLVRYRQDQQLEFIARADLQIKIRGFRIELGEIEAQLRQIADINDAVVCVQAQQIIAFLISDAPLLSAHTYRKLLQSQLPDYMLPLAFEKISEIPLSANGKINRSALPVIDINNISSTNDYVAPSNASEESLVLIWQTILQREKIGVRDSFFELGGNSLAATQLVNAINQQFAINLPLRSLFEIHTIEALAELIHALQGKHIDHIDEEFEEGVL